MMSAKCNAIHPVSFGLAAGIVWAFAVFLAGILSMFGFGVEFVKVMGSLYIGYAATFPGAVVGAIWAFIKLFIGGYLVAWIYNYFCCKVCDRCEYDYEEPRRKARRTTKG